MRPAIAIAAIALLSCHAASPVSDAPAGEGHVRLCVLDDVGLLEELACVDSSEAPPLKPRPGFTPTPLVTPQLAFGQVVMGTKALRRARLTNVGTGPLVLLGAEIDGSELASPGFTLDREVPTRTLKVGESVAFDVVLAPRSDDSPLQSWLVIRTDDPLAPEHRMRLVGTVLPSGLCAWPQGVDFGDLLLGKKRERVVGLKNCGWGVVSLLGIELQPDPEATPGAPLPFTLSDEGIGAILPGEERGVVVTYQPTRLASPEAPSDKARVVVRTDVGDFVVTLAGRGLEPGCHPPAIQPQARIDAFSTPYAVRPMSPPLRFRPYTPVVVDGAASILPPGGNATYAWTVIRQPAGEKVEPKPDATIASRATLQLGRAGEYELQLVVTDHLGCTGAPASVVLDSRPDRLRAELRWADPFGDLDLHLVGPGGSLFDSGGLFEAPSDCFFLNCKSSAGAPTIDWGRHGGTEPDGIRSNDPLFENDVTWGLGPEVVRYPAPFDGRYTIAAHNFCSRPSGNPALNRGPSTARLVVFVDDVEVFSAEHVLTQREAWEAAIVTVTDGSVTVTPSTAPIRRTTGDDEGCSASFD